MIKVAPHQSLLDIAIQEYGEAGAAVDLALENGLSITDAIEAGTEINMTKNKFLNTGTLNYYRENNIVPATAGTVVDTRNRGIGAMLIESNTSLVFEVN